MENLESLSCAAHGTQRGNGQIPAPLAHPLRLPAQHTSLLPTPPALPWGMFPSLCAHNKDFWLFPSHGAGSLEAGRREVPLPGGTRGSGSAAAGRDGASLRE